MNNPRYKNGHKRRRMRERFKAMGLPCAICGRAIHYDEPSDSKHPLSFVIDEGIPVSRYREFGYPSPQAAAQDWNNVQPVHWVCNARKGKHTMAEIGGISGSGYTHGEKNAISANGRRCRTVVNLPDGQW